jgi:hypothetical protein
MDIKVLTGSSTNELNKRKEFYGLFENSPIPYPEIHYNMGLYLNRQTLSRLLFMHELYLKILNVHGIVIEFGVRWGQNLALFQNLRGIYEPYNYNRTIVGFDTFSGFPGVSEKDGKKIQKGDYSVSENYKEYLDKILSYHESESPISHKKKYQLIEGDATKTFENFLKENPHIIIAFAYFDFDLYEPTKKCLELLLNRVTKGSIIAFDELNCADFPGETEAVREVLGLSKYAIKRSALNPLISYIEID